MATPGKLIVFEGIDGAGKSSAVAAAATFLSSEKIPFILLRQPGGTVVGEKLRTIAKEDSMTPVSEVLLFAACFRESIDQRIKPNLERGVTILCDRYIYSTAAYQVGGRGVDLDAFKSIMGTVHAPQPHATILFDVSADVAAKRTSARGALDRFELEGLEFQSKIRDYFLMLFLAGDINHKIDTSLISEDETSAATINIIKQLF